MVHKKKRKIEEKFRIALRSRPIFYKRVGFYLEQGFSEKEAVKKAEDELLGTAKKMLGVK